LFSARAKLWEVVSSGKKILRKKRLSKESISMVDFKEASKFGQNFKILEKYDKI